MAVARKFQLLTRIAAVPAWVIPGFLALHALVWTALPALLYPNLPLDLIEALVYGREWQLGYDKLPPLPWWLVEVAHRVIGYDFAYYLLAQAAVVAGFAAVWAMARPLIGARGALVALLILDGLHYFNYTAAKFNHDVIQLPFWALAGYALHRALRSGETRYWLLLGLTIGLSLWSKYFVAVLAVPLGIFMLADRDARKHLTTPGPYIALAAAIAAMAPHLVWLVQNDFAPFSYAMYIHGAKPFGATVTAALGYLVGSIGYTAIPVIAVLIAARPTRATMMDMVWPQDDKRRMAALAFWLPFLLPAVGAVASGTEITSLWSMPAWTLLPVLLLSSPDVQVRAVDTQRALLAAIVVPLIMLMASPAIAIMVHRNGPAPAAAQGQMLANQVERIWSQQTMQPLRFIGGDADIAYSVAAYAYDRPRALPGMPPPDAALLKRSGMVLLCFAEDTNCVSVARAHNPGGGVMTTEIWRRYWGVVGKPQRYNIVIVPPQP